MYIFIYPYYILNILYWICLLQSKFLFIYMVNFHNNFTNSTSNKLNTRSWRTNLFCTSIEHFIIIIISEFRLINNNIKVNNFQVLHNSRTYWSEIIELHSKIVYFTITPIKRMTQLFLLKFRSVPSHYISNTESLKLAHSQKQKARISPESLQKALRLMNFMEVTFRHMLILQKAYFILFILLPFDIASVWIRGIFSSLYIYIYIYRAKIVNQIDSGDRPYSLGWHVLLFLRMTF